MARSGRLVLSRGALRVQHASPGVLPTNNLAAVSRSVHGEEVEAIVRMSLCLLIASCRLLRKLLHRFQITDCCWGPLKIKGDENGERTKRRLPRRSGDPHVE
jgi:hypothetical protein